jgi:hypothetical protein
VRRDALEEVGPLDEHADGRALADYVAKVRPAGYRVACAEEVFVHPFGAVESDSDTEESATAAAIRRRAQVVESRRQTTDALSTMERRLEEVEARVAGTAARLERLRPPSGDRGDSAAAAHRVESAVRRHVPAGSTVILVGNGEETPDRLDGRETWHFPRFGNGHDRADDEAITTLERLRERGANYLVLPPTSIAWLEENEGFRRHLQRYARPSEDPEAALIYDLAAPADDAVAREGG